MYALCVSGAVNTQGFVWKFFYALYIIFHSFIHLLVVFNDVMAVKWLMAGFSCIVSTRIALSWSDGSSRAWTTSLGGWGWVGGGVFEVVGFLKVSL